jgi:hypothetical protein
MTDRSATPLRIRIARVIALFVLLPAGLICVGFPFYRFALPGGWGIIDDTRAAWGAGTDAGPLKAAYVDCVAERSGSNSSRGIGITEYACVIDLSEAPAPAPEAAPADDPWAGRSYAEGLAEYNRRYNAQMGGLAERSRPGVSNRIERKLATDRSEQLPAVRILSAPDEPRRVGLVWGWGELAGRWGGWLVSSVILFAFGGACLFAVRLSWKRR